MQRVLIVVMLFLIVFLQLKLWGRDGVPKVRALEQSITAQQAENARLKARNAALEAEVRNLKEGREAIEERARAELGLIGRDETFYHVIDGAAVPARPERKP
ncbi:cell division protein FtsB [Pseudofulvimonas gallinarii]|jgi:cell division protein FtsB|uniref:Cell division protein FtsB n=1 Tax=Pseudofulvimonas gallinarii TaxID=634155 RepID=A0A4S3KUJ8_9GAMM|nr:cell division protein FtsB [Pseudofulvimonas gallinarii]TCT00750.1 cell division protein FtsB [Pseudofulvimonas gallinarii]THD12786.1 cell division protein FtsB [Pseudofulvimonas gallinarii]